MCHDTSVELGWPACDDTAGLASTSESADNDCRARLPWTQLRSMVSVLSSMLDFSGSIGADVMTIDPTAPCTLNVVGMR